MTDPSWLPPLPEITPLRLRLVCVPFAGGGTGIYRSWQQAMPAGVQVVPVQLPGRERRLAEPAYTSMTALVADLHAALRPLLDAPWAVFGHSMGAAIAYELARAGTAGGHAPERLFVSARRAPGTTAPHPPLFALPDDRIIEQTEALYGPLPEALRRHPGLLAAVLPTLRADYRLLDTWRAPTDAALTCPIDAYVGAIDRCHDAAAAAGWASVTTGPFTLRTVPGGHFTGIRDRSDVRDDVARTLAAGLPEPR